ncbi:hypothetical protein DAPPUDRAFT_309625 [Daphnia pulex]|uniref:Uncharacterized protein n=1 Tax=Daphnia pulex TaxID=6669 RepID=E9FS20_DAPPU|nr:hypothetical protein DAPPUDRAFT_309625 [Daphnia pulex]|eukprot:EFX89955.1 hypothetical protein DAPPUDRAFT_309625 [Daphnia pulex]
MAFTSTASLSLFLMARLCCLLATTAEEDLPQAGENRESKQFFFAPQYYPTPQSQYYGPESSPYGNPFMNPTEGALLSQFSRVPSWPWAYPSSLPLDDSDPSDAAWRVHDGVDDKDKLKWWKKRFNRQALITIHPAAGECALADIAKNGLGPCKRASDAHHGTLEIKLQTKGQVAVVGITASSAVNTRIRLICTDLTAVAAFTHTGQITAVSDTPRTEIGSMQLVVTSTDANGVLRCNWRSYHYYTAAYP